MSQDDRIVTNCPQCGKDIRLAADAAGKKVRCGGCRTVQRIIAIGGGLRLAPELPTAPVESPAASASAAAPAPAKPIPAKPAHAKSAPGGRATTKPSPVVARTRQRATSPRRPSSSNTGRSVLGSIAAALLASVIGLGLMFWEKSEGSESVRGQLIEVLEFSAPQYRANSSYYLAMVDEYHKPAFEASCSTDVSDRRFQTTFDEKTYLRNMFTAIRLRAGRDGREEIADYAQEMLEGIEEPSSR